MSGFGHDTETLTLTVELPDGSCVTITGANDGVNGFTWSATLGEDDIGRWQQTSLPVKVGREVLIDGITPADDLPFHDPTCCHHDCRHPNLDHDADDEACEDANGQPLTLRPSETPTVECKFCGEQVPAATAHMHQGSYVGDDCCWDERLRSTE